MTREEIEEEKRRRRENQLRVIALAKEMAAERNKPKHSVTVRLTTKEYELFEKYCQMRGKTKHFVLRSIIRSLYQTTLTNE